MLWSTKSLGNPGSRPTRSSISTTSAALKLNSGGRICLANNSSERAMHGVALGRKTWLFAGSDRGGKRAAAIYTLIAIAKLNGIDPRAWLADVLRRIADHPAARLHELLPWNWSGTAMQVSAAAA